MNVPERAAASVLAPDAPDGPPPPSRSPERDALIPVSPYALERYRARILDPTTAARIEGQGSFRSTVYLGDRLLVSGRIGSDARRALDDAAAESDLRIVETAADQERIRRLRAVAEKLRVDAGGLLTTAIRLEPFGDKPVDAPDAWKVLQRYRTLVGPGSAAASQVALDHLLTANRHIFGTPFGGGVRSASPVPSGSYGEPGWGGRQPVRWLGGPPVRRGDFRGRRPVVAVLDTGIAKHPWFGPDVVHRNISVLNAPLGLPEPPDGEITPDLTDELEGVLDVDSGHGTFIAGLIRQQCPEADLLSVRVMPSDGAVPQHVLLDALNLLAVRQEYAQRENVPEAAVDVVTLSLGYYHESSDDLAADPMLREPIRTLGRCGVAVVVAAGNDATSRPMFPAAFAPHPGVAAERDCVPVVSVAATNPDGTTALFCNAGDWVIWKEPGAAVVSTYPYFDASGQAAFRFHTADGWRATVDPDSFRSGFAGWSGSSFAAPVLAGRLAQSIVGGDCGPAEPIQAASMLDRGWAAVTACAKVVRP